MTMHPTTIRGAKVACALAALLLPTAQAHAAAGQAPAAWPVLLAQLGPPRQDTLPPPENKRCADYAHRAVDDHATMRRFRQCFKPDDPRWQADYHNHYRWCLTARPDAPVSETKARDAHLMHCGVRQGY